MEATQSYPNLLSEKQAAKRLGIARITLLRAREAGRIRFFRIGTRVLYCEEQLTEFLRACERKGGTDDDSVGTAEPERHAARRKDNQVSQSRRSVSPRQIARPEQTVKFAKADQGSLPFTAAR
jgi:excisionase family DNA binding protein